MSLLFSLAPITLCAHGIFHFCFLHAVAETFCAFLSSASFYYCYYYWASVCDVIGSLIHIYIVYMMYNHIQLNTKWSQQICWSGNRYLTTYPVMAEFNINHFLRIHPSHPRKIINKIEQFEAIFCLWLVKLLLNRHQYYREESWNNFLKKKKKDIVQSFRHARYISMFGARFFIVDERVWAH